MHRTHRVQNIQNTKCTEHRTHRIQNKQNTEHTEYRIHRTQRVQNTVPQTANHAHTNYIPAEWVQWLRAAFQWHSMQLIAIKLDYPIHQIAPDPPDSTCRTTFSVQVTTGHCFSHNQCTFWAEWTILCIGITLNEAEKDLTVKHCPIFHLWGDHVTVLQQYLHGNVLPFYHQIFLLQVWNERWWSIGSLACTNGESLTGVCPSQSRAGLPLFCSNPTPAVLICSSRAFAIQQS